MTRSAYLQRTVLAIPGLAAAVGVAVLLAAWGLAARAHDPGWLWAAVAALAGLVAVSPLADRLDPGARVAHLPGYADRFPPPKWWTWPVLAAGGVLAAGTWAVAPRASVATAASPSATSVDPTVTLVLMGVFLVFALYSFALSALRWRDRPAAGTRVRDALAAYGPTVAIYTARVDGAHQVLMWLPALQSAGARPVVITRDPAGVAGMRRDLDVPIVSCPTWRDLDAVVVPSLRACFYPNTLAANSDFVTYRTLRHIYVGHGESDKAMSRHPAHAMFDILWVAGQVAIERYARDGILIPAEKFVVVGRPQTVAIAPRSRTLVRRVLYAPTWQGYNASSEYSSLRHGPAIVTRLVERGFEVTFRPHPFSWTQRADAPHVEATIAVLRADRGRSERRHRWQGQASFADDANESDAMLCDVSSVVIDYLAADKPFGVIATTDREQFARDNPLAVAASVVDADLANLDQVLDELGRDANATGRLAISHAYLGGMSGTQAQAVVTGEVTRLLGG